MTPLSAFPVSRLRLTARARDSLRLADYAGSQLRGAFGAAYRQLACLTRQKTCTDCPISVTCPYHRVFESAPPPAGHPLQRFSQVPHPYLIFLNRKEVCEFQLCPELKGIKTLCKELKAKIKELKRIKGVRPL